MNLKLSYFLFLLIVFIIPVQAQSQNDITIYGNVVNPISKSISISFPVNNTSSWAIAKKIALDKENNFVFKSFDSGFYNIRYEIAPFNYISAKLLLFPDDSCYLNFDVKNQTVNFYCNNNQVGLELYNKLIEQQLKLNINAENKFENYLPFEISDTINKSKTSQINQMSELLRKGLINNKFFESIAKDISYFYASLYYDLIGHIVFMSEQMPGNHPQHLKQSGESLHFADSTLSQLFSPFETGFNNYIAIDNANLYVSSTNSDFIYSGEYINLLAKYIHYKSIYQPHQKHNIEIDAINNSFHNYNLNYYADYLKGKDFEYAVSLYFYTWFQVPRIANLLNPYESFKKYYPNNPFIPFVDSVANEYRNFRNIKTTNFAENIVFIPNSNSINSFDSLLNQFAGKTVYIDIWGSSCPPCLKEFEYYKNLYPFFSMNDIELLFISVDKSTEVENWKKTIKKYNLIGNHILANNFLKKDIRKKTNMIGIPWYCIKTKNGKLSSEFIHRPSSDKMKQQIKKFIENN